ncbi:MAG: hypothetical protein AABX19_00890 [Nanoarchaeota archaeon]
MSKIVKIVIFCLVIISIIVCYKFINTAKYNDSVVIDYEIYNNGELVYLKNASSSYSKYPDNVSYSFIIGKSDDMVIDSFSRMLIGMEKGDYKEGIFEPGSFLNVFNEKIFYIQFKNFSSFSRYNLKNDATVVSVYNYIAYEDFVNILGVNPVLGKMYYINPWNVYIEKIDSNSLKLKISPDIKSYVKWPDGRWFYIYSASEDSIILYEVNPDLSYITEKHDGPLKIINIKDYSLTVEGNSPLRTEYLYYKIKLVDLDVNYKNLFKYKFGFGNESLR